SSDNRAVISRGTGLSVALDSISLLSQILGPNFTPNFGFPDQCLAEIQRSPIAIEPCRYFWPLAVCLAERLCDGEVAELDAIELYRDHLRLERHRVGDAADLGKGVTILPCRQARHRIVEGGANRAEQRHQRSARQQRPPYVAAAGGEET